MSQVVAVVNWVASRHPRSSDHCRTQDTVIPVAVPVPWKPNVTDCPAPTEPL